MLTLTPHIIRSPTSMEYETIRKRREFETDSGDKYVTDPDVAAQYDEDSIGLYVQDDWLTSSRVTLNAGVRYEFITVPTEAHGRSANFPDIATGTTTAIGPLFENPSYGNVAPRLGFAWDLAGDGKSVLRGGAGIFYEPILGNVYRAYGNRTPPFYELINPANPAFPAPTSAGDTPLLRLDLFEYQSRGEEVVITKNGRPCAVLMPVTEDTDLEIVAISQNKRFWEVYDRAASRAQEEGWTSLDDL